nr:MAG TPA: hypothetical protein [Caudoviricetes sp.]
MSIFGKGHYEKIPILKGEDMPSNIYKVRNVLNKTYFESLFYNATSEFTMMIGEILGVDIATQLKMVDDINVFDMTDSKHSQLENGLYLATQNFSLYIKPGKDMYLIPFNLTNIYMETIQKPEFEAVYYCKFDETPLPIVPIVANKFMPMNKLFSLAQENTYSSNYHRELFSSTNMYRSKAIFKYIRQNMTNGDSHPTTIYFPKVRVNTWKMPIFTDAHVNTIALIRDLDIQIDFMALPFSKRINDIALNMESAPVAYVEKEPRYLGPENEGAFNYISADDITNSHNVINYSPFGNYIKFRRVKNISSQYPEFEEISGVYTSNKRPNRHLRYLVSAYGYFDKPNFPGTEYKTTAQYVRVNKVYDSEGEQPLSPGFAEFSSYTDKNETITQNFRYPIQQYEGIHPDPEDLTNPMDISVDFEFVQCKLNEKFEPVDTVQIGNKRKTLFGYLVIKAYSGYVGSTLHDGVYDIVDSNIGGEYGNVQYHTAPKRFTSYDTRTRPHDVMFKVTLRTSKYQNCTSGNFTNVTRNNIDDAVTDSGARSVWNMLATNIDRNNIIINNAEAEKRHALDRSIKPDAYNESPIYFAPTLNTIDKNIIFKKFEETSGGIYPSFMSSYEKSPDYLWGEFDFYNYRILDKGGYLRPPIQDTVIFLRESWKGTEWNRRYSTNYFTGPINWATASLDKYWYDADIRVRNMIGIANVGGLRLDFKL